MSLLQNSNAISSGGAYNLTDSLRIRSSGELTRTPSTQTNRRTWTWSGWIKRINGTQWLFGARGVYTGQRFDLYFADTDGSIRVLDQAGSDGGGGTQLQKYSTRSFRDLSAWYHVVCTIDTTQTTASDRVKVWVNNELIDSWATNVDPAQNFDTAINTTVEHRMGSALGNSNVMNYNDGYFAEVNFVAGQALTPLDFGEYDDDTGIWKPKKYTGTYGTNGFYLPMKATTQASGFNTVTYTGTGTDDTKITDVGFQPDFVWIKDRSNARDSVLFDSVRGATNYLRSSTTGAEGTASDTLKSFNSDGFTLGTNVANNGSAETYVAWCWEAPDDNATGSELVTNGTFDTNTSGWTASDATLAVSNQKLAITRVSGGGFGQAYQAITTISGKMYAIKFDTEAVGNGNYVKVGTSANGSQNAMFGPYTADVTNAVGTFIATSTTTYITIFGDTSSGVTSIWDNISVKEVTQDGSIPSYYKTNTAKGFSIVDYTGTGADGTVGHGLGSTPEMIIVKNRDTISDWRVWHTGLSGDNYYVSLNLTDAEATSTGLFGTHTSNVISLKSGFTSNGSGNAMVAYCFSEVSGFSKFGSYTGNGSTSGPTITTGFRPAFLLVKRIDAINDWGLYDNTRDPDNNVGQILYANLTIAEGSYPNNIAFLDNGFQLIGTASSLNSAGGTYIYMAFADTRNRQWNFDASGNKNNWTPNNINSNASSESTYDLMSDVPTLTDEDTGNFCTWNPLNVATNITTTNANLSFNATTTTGNHRMVRATHGMTSGKYYWEVHVNNSANVDIVGVSSMDWNGDPYNTYVGGHSASAGYGYSTSNGNWYGNGFSINGATPPAHPASGIIGVAFDADNGELYFHRNGTWINSANPSAGTGSNFTATTTQSGYLPAISTYNNQGTWTVNFGQQPFKYTPPTGFKKLNTFNLPDSTIVDGNQHFNTVLYTGNSGTQSITDVGFQPDFVWTKARNGPYSNTLINSVRGNTKILFSNTTDAETTETNNITGFTSTGYTLGNSNNVNGGYNYVGWNWRGSDSTAVSNTSGSVTSTVSANTTAGFSISTFAASGTFSVGHGLGVQPDVLILKSTNNVENWICWWRERDSVPTRTARYLNTTTGTSTAGSNWLTTANASIYQFVTGQFFSAGNFVAYSWAEVEGYSKFGTYTGNGSADGAFIHTGFKPAFWMSKRVDTTGSWVIIDTERSAYNTALYYLIPNSSGAENTATWGDFVSNGFKLRNSGSHNDSGATYIYMAFAENPFKNSLAR